MARKYVESSNVEFVEYFEETQTLEIGFLNGSVYQYFDVPQNIAEALSNASSVGSYLASNIKGHYRYSKI